MNFKTFDFKTATDSSDGEFAGYASVFGNVDADGDIMERGAFTKSLPEFLADGFVAWQHDWANPIGKPVEASEDEKGLYVRASISDTALGRDARTLIKDGVVKRLSIGYKTMASRILTEMEGVTMLGEVGYASALKSTWRDGIRLITECKLYEISPVSVPANGEARILAAKGLLDGIPFAEHSQTVLDTAKGFVTRIRALAELRKSEGKQLSDEKRALLGELFTELSTAACEVKSVLALISDEEKDGADDALMGHIKSRAKRRQMGVLLP